jgi:hypothetical protein
MSACFSVTVLILAASGLEGAFPYTDVPDANGDATSMVDRDIATGK